MADYSITANGDTGPLPPDDLSRSLTVSNPDDPNLLHLSVVGDNYTVLVSGKQTEGRYCLIDMLVPGRQRPAAPPPQLRGDVHAARRRSGVHLPRPDHEGHAGRDGEHPG